MTYRKKDEGIPTAPPLTKTTLTILCIMLYIMYYHQLRFNIAQIRIT